MRVKELRAQRITVDEIRSHAGGTPVIGDAGAAVTGAGASASAYTATTEQNAGMFRKTTITCTALPVTITDDAGTAQYGGTKIYDFPEGLLMTMGAVVSGSITAGVTGTIIDNWDGDVALGTVTATTGATLTSTEADILQSTAVSAGASDKIGVVSAVTIATALTESGARWFDGTATAKDMYLNFVIDDDATHTAGTAAFTGTVTFMWAVIGDK